MNGLIRAVREAERQLRDFPPALSALLRADVVAQRISVETGWADTSPFADLGAVGAAVGGADAEAPSPRRATPPAPLRRSPRTTAGVEPERSPGALGRALAGPAGARGGAGSAAEAVAQGVVQAVQGVAAGVTAGTTRVAPAGSPGAPAGPLGEVGKALIFSLRGGRGGVAEAAGAPAAAPREERSGGIGALGRAVAAAAAAAETVPPPGSAEAAGAAVLTGVGEAVAGVFDSTLRRIAERLDTADQRARGAPASDAAEAAAAAAARTSRTPRPGKATGTPAAAGPAPVPPSAEPVVRDPLLPPVSAGATAPTSGDAAAAIDGVPAVDPEWVVAVVSDALLEQARRQGVDLT